MELIRDLGNIMVVVGKILNTISLYTDVDQLVWRKILIMKKRENNQGKEVFD